MKKILLSLAIALIAIGGWRARENYKTYLKTETWAKHLKKDVFLAKLQKPLPQWMKEQIEEDFQPFRTISSEKVDATFSQIVSRMNPRSEMVRYRIFKGELYRYFLEGEPISLEDNSTEKALKTLLALLPMPDLDFLLSYFDGVPLCGMNESLYRTQNSDFQAPLLFSAKKQGTPFIVLIPDWRSIGHWWISDIKAIRSKADRFPWEKKKNRALWRGSLTKSARLDLCRLSLCYPERLDAKLNVEVTDPEIQKKIEEEGVFGGRASWEDFLECKYLPYVDGVMCAAPALQWRLLSRSLVFKPESDEIQWFYRALKPYVHYVPVKGDLSDLIERFEWAEQNDPVCREIADRATQFAQENLMYEDVLLYFAAVLKRYSSLQPVNQSEWADEMKKERRWVKIQSRQALKREANKRKMDGFVNQATPF